MPGNLARKKTGLQLPLSVFATAGLSSPVLRQGADCNLPPTYRGDHGCVSSRVESRTNGMGQLY